LGFGSFNETFKPGQEEVGLGKTVISDVALMVVVVISVWTTTKFASEKHISDSVIFQAFA